MCRTRLERNRRRFAIPYQLHLPPFLDRTHAFCRSPTHRLQDHDAQKHQANMTHHRPIRPASARLQARVLLGVVKEGLHAPAAHLALDDAREIGTQLEGMRERTPRGGREWKASSVKFQLDRARKMGLAVPDIQ